jgi:predicted Zn-dependent protease
MKFRMIMKYVFLPVLLIATIVACSSVPITGRSQLNMVSSTEIQAMSYSEYDKFLQENTLSTNAQQTQMVKRIGLRIQKAVEQFMEQEKLSDRLKGYEWDFNLVESDQVNAWCMPGGKVVVYSGLLPITKDETGLAVVMGHEIAHAIAEHGNERMSQGLLAQMGGAALDAALAEKPQETRALWMTAFGLGVQVGALLPYSRLHESEADHLGIIFMAMAGYDPNRAVAFWERMAANKGGQAPPEFLSTHPSDATRISEIKEHLPEAMKYYKKP